MARTQWFDTPSTASPLSAAMLNDLEARKPEVEYLPINVRDAPYNAVGDGAADDTSAIQAALTACNAQGGGTVYLPNNDFSFTTLSFAGMSNVRLVGAGTQATWLRSSTTTGNLFDFTGASFCAVENLSFGAPVQRTAGAVFYLDHGAGTCQRNEFRRLRMHGGWRAWFLDDCSTTTIDEIQFTDYVASHTWHSVIHFGGAALSTIITNIRGGTAAATTNGFLYIEGASVDTAHFRDWDILALTPSTGMRCATIVAGEWIEFTNCSMEAGTTQHAVWLGGSAKGVGFTSCHFLGLTGIEMGGGTSVRIIGGEVVRAQRDGVILSGGTHHEIIGMTISDVSQETNSTYQAINVASGVNDFTIVDCHIGEMLATGNGNNAATAITVGGTNDRYVICRNRIVSASVTTPLNDAGTGTDKVVRDNVWVGSGFPSVTAAANINPNGTLSSAEVISVTGNTGITSMTAGAKGRRVTFVFSGTPTVTDGSNLKLAGNFVAAGTTGDVDTLTLVSDGTNWIEVSRSTN